MVIRPSPQPPRAWDRPDPPPASAGATQATPKISNNVTAATEYATPTALKGGNYTLNITLPTGLEDQEIPVETDSDVTLAVSFGRNDNDSTYLE